MKYAVVYGTIKLNNGSTVTYSAAEIAELYNVQDEPYVPVPLDGPSPFNGAEELEYVRLIPRPDGVYFDAKQRYNQDGGEYWDDDFDAKEGGKWAVKPRHPVDDSTQHHIYR